MLLSTCFLVFILWFCCLASLKRHKSQIKQTQLEKSINETKYNLKELGIKLKNEKKIRNVKQDPLKVKDDDKNENLFLTTIISSRPPSPRMIKNNVEQGTNTKDFFKNCNTHEYDIVHDNKTHLNRSNKNDPTYATKDSKNSSNKNNKQSVSNKGYESEHDYYSGNDEEIQSIIGFKDKTDDDNVVDVSKYVLTKPKKELDTKHSKNINPIESSDMNQYLSIKTLPRLTKDQIEKEYREYRLQLKKQINDQFSDSQSTATAQSPNIDAFEYYESIAPKKIGIYSHNFKLKNNNKISEIKSAYENDGQHFLAARLIKMINQNPSKPRAQINQQIWHI